MTSSTPIDVLRLEELPAAGSLDPICVYWRDVGSGQGFVTITCWGQAWTCYFGAMPATTIREFFAHADVSYLVAKLGITPLLKCRKRDFDYLAKIVRAIKEKILSEVPTE